MTTDPKEKSVVNVQMGSMKNFVGKLFLVFLALSLLFSFVSAADISAQWTCENGLLDHCENFRVFTNSEKTEGPYCGLARSMYGYELPLWQTFADLKFNVPSAGNYSCTVAVLDTGYGYYSGNGPQTQEYENVSLAGIYLGKTIDWKCNSGSGSCSSCDNYATTFTKNLTLNAGTNSVYLKPYQSHAIRGASIECTKIIPPIVCTPTTEICDGVDNNCNGQVDENLFKSTNQSGICSSNTQTCTNGNWVNRSNNTLPSTESCNNLDDNCNGQIDENLVRNSTNQLGLCSGNQQTCTNGNWFNLTTNYNSSTEVCDLRDNDCDGLVDEGNICGVCTPTTEICNGLDDDCDLQVDEGNVCGTTCTNGQTRNSTAVNFCSGLNVLTNSSYELCSNNLWQQINVNNIFTASCSGNNQFVNQSCSGNVLVQNWSQPACASGSCTRTYFTNQTTCAYGCSNNQCSPPTGFPTCSVDSLTNQYGQNIFNLNNFYFNQSGMFLVYGSANANSNNFTLVNVNYNRTSPNWNIDSWEDANSQDALFHSWRTDSNDPSFVEGNHTVCCQAVSQKCVGSNNCEFRTSNVSCSSFCIDTQDPSVNINNVAGMGSWNSTVFNWSWSASDLGCAGLKNYNFTVKDSNGTIIQNSSNYAGSSVISAGLVVNHSYTLTVYVFDNAGNFGSAISSILVINLTNGSNPTNGSNSSLPYVKITYPVNGSICKTSNLLNVTANLTNVVQADYSFDQITYSPFVSGMTLSFNQGWNNIYVRGMNQNGTTQDYVQFYLNTSCTVIDDDDDDNGNNGGSAYRDRPIYLNNYGGNESISYNNATEGIYLGSPASPSKIGWNFPWLILLLLIGIIILILLIIWRLLTK